MRRLQRLRSLRQAARQRGQASVVLAGCWAHARRYFYEALDHVPKEAGWILIQIAHLYEIERRLRHHEAGPALREAYRTSQSTPICRRIHRVLQRWFLTRRFLPKSSMGKALSYALGQWESLEIYLQEPAIEIDTNLVENAIRPTALGKNYEQSGIMQSWKRKENSHFRCAAVG